MITDILATVAIALAVAIIAWELGRAWEGEE